MTATRSPAFAIARNDAWRMGASGVVAWASLAAWIPPIRVAAVPVMPVRMPAASSAAVARKQVVVLPSVPVTDDGQILAWIAVPPGRRGREGGGRSLDHELWQVQARVRTLDERHGSPAGGGVHQVVVAVDVQPGDGDEHRATSHGP